MNRFEFRTHIWKNRISSLPKEIKILSLLALLSILSIELLLKEIPAPSTFVFNLGTIYLKLCYSFLSAAIFYFLIVHIPKEKRKLKVFRLISNKVWTINFHVFNLVNAVFNRQLDPKDIYEIKAGKITELCKKINPDFPVTANDADSATLEKVIYKNWVDFFNTSVNGIKNAINEILILSESVDTNLLESLTHIKDTSKWFVYKNRSNTNNLKFLSHSLNQLKNDSYDLFKCFHKAYGRFTVEYHTSTRKRNLELIGQGKL